MLIPSLVGAATGYLTFAAFHGTEPLFAIAAAPPFNYVDLIAALALGVGSRARRPTVRPGPALGEGPRATRTAAWQRVTIAGGD